jgi:phosphopantetheinyl transferase
MPCDSWRYISHEKIWCDLHAGSESEALTTLWTIKESVWKTLQGTYDVSLSDIAVQFEHDFPRPVLCNRPTDGPQFRTQAFRTEQQTRQLPLRSAFNDKRRRSSRQRDATDDYFR